MMMARAKNIVVGPAAEARRRIGLNTAAEKLRAAGWIAVSPEEQKLLGETAQALVEAQKQIQEPSTWPGDDAPLWKRVLWGLTQS